MHSGFGEAPAPSRRQCFRQPVRPLAYVSLGEGNGGILLNLAESGMAVQAVSRLHPGVAARVRFELPGMQRSVDATAEVVWSDSTNQAGMRFLHLAGHSRGYIKEWMLTWQLAQAHGELSFPASAEPPPPPPLEPAPAPPVGQPLESSTAAAEPAETSAPAPSPPQSGGPPSWMKDLDEEDHSGSRRVALIAVLVVLAAAAILGMGWRWLTSSGVGSETTLSQRAPQEEATLPPEDGDVAATPMEPAAAEPAQDGSEPAAAPPPAATLPRAEEALRGLQAAGPVSLSAVRFAMVQSGSRVTLEFDRPVRYRVGRLHRPERIYLDLLDTRMAVRGWGRAGTLPLGDLQVQQVRVAEGGDGNTRVVLDLNCACEYSITLPPGAPPRVVIDLRPVP